MEQPPGEPLMTYELPRKRRRSALPLALILLLVALGLGFLSYRLFTRQKSLASKLSDLRKRSKSLADALELHRASKVSLNRKLVACKKQVKVHTVNEADTGARVASLTSKLAATRSRVESLEEQRRRERRQLRSLKLITRQFRRMISAGQLDIAVRRGKIIVKLPTAVLFPVGKATLSKKGKKAIAAVARVLRRVHHPRFTVAGHTDDQRIRGGEFPSNWELSAARAVTVVKQLARAGMPARKLAAAGFGPYDPVASNRSAKGRRRNRRIEIVLEPYVRRQLVKKIRKKNKRRKHAR